MCDRNGMERQWNNQFASFQIHSMYGRTPKKKSFEMRVTYCNVLININEHYIKLKLKI